MTRRRAISTWGRCDPLTARVGAGPAGRVRALESGLVEIGPEGPPVTIEPLESPVPEPVPRPDPPLPFPAPEPVPPPEPIPELIPAHLPEALPL